MYYEEGVYPADVILLQETSITLTELDRLKKEDPERYWEIYFWILTDKLEQKRQMDKLKEGSQDTGSKDVGSVRNLEQNIREED